MHLHCRRQAKCQDAYPALAFWRDPSDIDATSSEAVEPTTRATAFLPLMIRYDISADK